MLQVLNRDRELMKSNVCSLAYKEQLPFKGCLGQVMLALEDCYFDAPGGCLMANIRLESAQEVPEFSRVIKLF